MARLRQGTKHILATARQTKEFSKAGRNALAKRLRAGRTMAKSNYKYQGKQIKKLQGSTYGHRVSPTHL